MIRVLIADDEGPARQRLVQLLEECRSELPNQVVGQATNGREVLEMVASARPDVVLLDIQMPVMSGLETARHLAAMADRPAVIFVTAYDEHALDAFEVRALDYLLKPIRRERLAEALCRIQPIRGEDIQGLSPRRLQFCSVERGKVWLIPLEDVLYLRAEQKYVIARTRDREYLLDESLVHLETEFPDVFLRIHRNCLVARSRLQGFERVLQGEEMRWQAILLDWPERLPVSRRQLHVVKEFKSVQRD